MYRTGSLFFELSQQLRDELREAERWNDEHCEQGVADNLSLRDDGSFGPSPLVSARSSRHNSRFSCGTVDDGNELAARPPLSPCARSSVTSSRPNIPLAMQLHRRQSRREDSESMDAAPVTPAPTATSTATTISPRNSIAPAVRGSQEVMREVCVVPFCMLKRSSLSVCHSPFFDSFSC